MQWWQKLNRRKIKLKCCWVQNSWLVFNIWMLCITTFHGAFSCVYQISMPQRPTIIIPVEITINEVTNVLCALQSGGTDKGTSKKSLFGKSKSSTLPRWFDTFSRSFVNILSFDICIPIYQKPNIPNFSASKCNVFKDKRLFYQGKSRLTLLCRKIICHHQLLKCKLLLPKSLYPDILCELTTHCYDIQF